LSERSFTINARFAGARMTGVQRSAFEIVSRLVREDPDKYKLYAPPPREKENDPSLNIEHRGRIRHGHLWEQLELPQLMKRTGREGVLYSPVMSGPLAVKRQVLTMHDLFPVENPEWFSRAYSAWYRLLIPRLLRRVAYIMASSEYTRERILCRYGLPEDKVVLCRLAHNERFAPLSDEEAARFREEQGLPDRYLLYVGSVEPRKNLKTLVSAWKRTLAHEQGVKLVIAGGAGQKAVFNAAESGAELLQDPTIRSLGYFSDESLPLLYGAAEAFALPSLAEGFGFPVLEAMACGTPVICSNTTSTAEVAGEAARLEPPLEAEAWTQAIDSTLSDPATQKRMRLEGLKRASGFSWSKAAATVRETLEAV